MKKKMRIAIVAVIGLVTVISGVMSVRFYNSTYVWTMKIRPNNSIIQLHNETCEAYQFAKGKRLKPGDTSVSSTKHYNEMFDNNLTIKWFSFDEDKHYTVQIKLSRWKLNSEAQSLTTENIGLETANGLKQTARECYLIVELGAGGKVTISLANSRIMRPIAEFKAEAVEEEWKTFYPEYESAIFK